MATEGIITGNRQKRHTRFVDMWIAPGLNPTNIDILKKLKSADDRQFSRNMAVTGKGFDEDREAHHREETQVFGIRTDVWRPSKEVREKTLVAMQKQAAKEERAAKSKEKSVSRDTSDGELDHLVLEDSEPAPITADDIDKSRLVLKMFRNTSTRIRWQGTIEEMTVREIQNSLGSRRALISFAALLEDYEHLIIIQENHRLFRIPPSYSFSFYQPKTDRMWYIDLDCHWVSIGVDFTIRAQGRKIGRIDGKLVSLGADSRVHVWEPCLAEDEQFMDLLSLFAASVGFHKQIHDNIERRVRNVKQGRPVHFVEDEEMWLLKNPRRIAR
jgi:hypothetical protein